MSELVDGEKSDDEEMDKETNEKESEGKEESVMDVDDIDRVVLGMREDRV
jgi:hypothetical protein